MFRKFALKDFFYLFKTRVLNTQPGEKIINKRYMFLIILFGLIIFGFLNFEANIKPTVIAMAEARAQAIAVSAVNEAINEEIVKNINYNDLVSLQRDDQSRITALQVNVVKVNQMQAKVTQIVQKKMEGLDTSELRVPLGNLMGSSIFAGWGPRIRIRILPLGTIQSNFNGDFSNAGINQTRHRITLVVKCKMSIMVPFVSSNKEFTTSMSVAETIIVGNVPQTYLDVSGASDAEKQQAAQIAPNLINIGN